MFSVWEVIQIIITIFAVGFIFSPWRPGYFNSDLETQDQGYERIIKAIGFGAAIAAPAVLFHELAHKFLALHFGFTATYSASFIGLAIGIALKLFSPGFIFFLPGYVSISGHGTPLQFGLVALAGPLTNLALFLIFLILAKVSANQPNSSISKYSIIWEISKSINLWLFIFNMLPIPGLDGFKFYASLLS